MKTIQSPNDLYQKVVSVDVAEFTSQPDNLRFAFHACVSLLSLRDWVFECHKNNPWTWQKVLRGQMAGKHKFQIELETICPEFRLVVDVANASKHLRLDHRKRSQAQGAANVGIQTITTAIGGALVGAMQFNAAMPNQPPTVNSTDVVVIDDGGALYDVVQAVNDADAVWKGLLAENGWT